MAISFQQGASNGAANAGPVTVTFGSTPAAGDLILLFYADGDTTDNAMPAISGYTDVGSSEQYANGSSHDCNSRAYYRYSDGTETNVVCPDTGGGTNDGVSAVVMIFRGVASAAEGGPFSTAPTLATGTGGANADNPQIATAAGDVVVIMGACATTNAPGARTAPANYTTNAELGTNGLDTVSSAAFMAYRTSGYGNPEDPPAWSVSGSSAGNSWNAVTLALKEAPTVVTGVVLTITPSLPVGSVIIFDQAGFRARNDDGSETTATWKAAENANWTQAVDENFRVRFVADEIAGGDPPAYNFQLQYNLNGAGWVDATDVSSVVRGSLSPNFVDGAATTRQLTAGTGTFFAGSMDESNCRSSSLNLAAGNLTEVEYCVQIRSADVANNDSLQLRVVLTSGATPVSSLHSYTNTPTITVSEGGGQTVTGVVLTVTPSLPTGALTHTLTGVVLAVVPSLPVGKLDHGLTGVVLTVTPSLPAGSLDHSLTGVVLTIVPSLPVGKLDHALTGVVLTITPSLPAGQVTIPGSQTVTGVVLTITPSLPAGALAHTITGVVLTIMPSMPVGALAHTITGVVLTVTPSLPIGNLDHGLAGVVLTITPSTPAGALAHTLRGVVLAVAPSFPVGNVAVLGTVTAVVLVIVPTLPAGEVFPFRTGGGVEGFEVGYGPMGQGVNRRRKNFAVGRGRAIS